MFEFEEIKFAIKLFYDRSSRKRLVGLRPGVICLVTTRNSGQQSEFLLIRPSADTSVWMPPQEGMNFDESIEHAAARCLWTELGIAESEIQFRKSRFLGDRVFGPEREGERDIHFSVIGMRGKSYFAALVYVDRGVEVNLNPAEVYEHKWVGLDQITEHISSAEESKRAIISKAFHTTLGHTV